MYYDDDDYCDYCESDYCECDQEPQEEVPDNLVSIASFCRKPKEKTEISFEENIKKYEKNQKRLADERKKANKSVTRSHNLKK